MGISHSYRRISVDNHQRFLADQDFAEDLRFGGDPLEVIAAGYDSIDGQEKAGRYLSIEKEWQALHFLITGEQAILATSQVEPPLRNVIMGGSNTPYEATYDYVRYLIPEEVKAVAEALRDIGPADLRIRFRDQFAEADDLYANPSPDLWDESDWEYMLGMYERLRNFFSQAAEQHEAMIISLD